MTEIVKIPSETPFSFYRNVSDRTIFINAFANAALVGVINWVPGQRRTNKIVDYIKGPDQDCYDSPPSMAKIDERR